WAYTDSSTTKTRWRHSRAASSDSTSGRRGWPSAVAQRKSRRTSSPCAASGCRASRTTQREGQMDLGLDEQQEMLKNVARDFLEKECPESLVRQMEEDDKGYSPELWQKMAERGWMGLTIPDQYGGAGLTLCELVVLLEEFGRALVP